MRKSIAGIVLELAMFGGVLLPATAHASNRTALRKVAACKGTSGETNRLCRILAEMEAYKCDFNKNGTVTRRPSGVKIIESIRSNHPYRVWITLFRSNIKDYNDCHFIRVP